MSRVLGIFLISIVFWNLENCFDPVDSGTGASDTEFSSKGQRHWTWKRFNVKMAMIGKSVLCCEPLPDVVGFAEVENRKVVNSLVYGDILRKLDYRPVHYDSPDPRGIDVALIYRGSKMQKIASYPLPVKGTRDILYVCLQDRSSGEIWHFFVNHHPSKYSGAASAEGRQRAMKTLCSSVDSLLSAGARNIVAMGDFNDSADSPLFSLTDGRLVNKGLGLKEGSIRFKGRWQLIDNFLVSADVASATAMEVLRPPFLLERDKQFPGMKPRRTYIGPRYNGGVSDHLPVHLKTASE